MSDEQDNETVSFNFEVDADVTHNVPPELKDKLSFVDGDEEHCRECGEVMTDIDQDDAPRCATHYCPECGVYKSVGGIGEVIFGP